MEDLDPHLPHASLGPPESITQTASRLVQPLCTAHGRVSSGMPGHNLFPKLPLCVGDQEPHLIHVFLGPPKSRAYFKEYLGQFSRLCTAHIIMSSGMSGHGLPLNIAHREIWTPSNTWFLGQPTQHPKQHLGQPFLHSLWQTVPVLYNWRSPKLPVPMGRSRPHLIHDFLGPSKPTTQTASRSFQLFLHSSSQSVPISYSGSLPQIFCVATLFLPLVSVFKLFIFTVVKNLVLNSRTPGPDSPRYCINCTKFVS